MCDSVMCLDGSSGELDVSSMFLNSLLNYNRLLNFRIIAGSSDVTV